MLNENTVAEVVGALEPDVKDLVFRLAEEETWAHAITEIPGEVVALGNELPKFIVIPVTERQNAVVDDILVLCAHFDIKLFITLIIFLERGVISLHEFERKAGWGSYLFLRAEHHINNRTGLLKESQVIVGRLQATVRHMMLLDILLDNQAFLEIKEKVNA